MLSKAYQRYVLATLTLVYTLSLVDRGLIILLLQPIKEDLRLSDTQLGLLTGIAFALFYSTLGLPIARWSDRGNRVTISAITIGLWGVTIMSCLWVSNFTQLLFARIAAAVGEAGCMPPTYSLVGDYFPKPAERARAMAIYMLASPLCLLGSFIIGGWLNERYGWRMTFFLMGIPGLLVAGLVKLTVRDPRQDAGVLQAPAEPQPRLREVVAVLWRQRSCRHMILGLILLFMMGNGIAPWYAAFLMRSHAMGTAEIGTWLGLIFGIGGIAGTLLGGYVTSRWFAEDARSQMRLSAVTIAFVVPCYVLFLVLPQKSLALMAMVPLLTLLFFFCGPTFALLQRLVRDEMRATTLAIVMLLANLIGLGIGPQVVGILSDLLMPEFGRNSLRYAMLIMSFVSLWSAYHFWRAGYTVQEDLRSVAELGGRTLPELSPKYHGEELLPLSLREASEREL